MDLRRRGVEPASGANAAPPGIGERYGHLVVVDEGEPYYWRGRISRRRWICECECGNTTLVRDDLLRSGQTKSCGCEKVRINRILNTRHGYRAGHAYTPEYDAWRTLMAGAREDGITVARAWTGEDGFGAFIRDVGQRPGPKHRLARPSAGKPFGPGNAKWCTEGQKKGSPRRLIKYQGRKMTLREVASATGLTYSALQKRLSRGWRISEVFKTPLRAWTGSSR